MSNSSYIHLDNANLRNRITFHVKWMGLAPIIRTYLEKDRKMLTVYSLLFQVLLLYAETEEERDRGQKN